MLLRRQEDTSSPASSSYQQIHLSPSILDFTSEPDYSSFSDFSELPDNSFMSGQPFQFHDPFYWSPQSAQYSHASQLLSSAHPDSTFDFAQQSAAAASNEWQLYNHDGSFNPNAVSYSPAPKLRPHRRALSNSTATSYASTSSPRQIPAAYDNSYLDPNVYSGQPQVHHHYPTPTQTPTQDSFVDQGKLRQARAVANMDRATAAHRTMKNTGVANESNNQQHGQYYLGGNNEYLATPKTINGDYMDRQPPSGTALGEIAFMNFGNGMHNDSLLFDEPLAMRRMPDLSRTMSDICQDELYNPPSNVINTSTQPHQQLGSASRLQPHGGVMSNRLQAANEARTSSSPADLKREHSPFRPTSPYASGHGYGSVHGGAVGTASAQRRQQKAEADAQAIRQHQMVREDSAVNTISPQEAYLDHFHDPAEDSVARGLPLFPQGVPSQQSAFDAPMARPIYGPLSDERRIPTSNFNFQSPSQHTTNQTQSAGNFKYGTLQHRASGDSNDEIPLEFPAHLVSMETSKSEAEPESSSQEADMEKPAGRTADGGTYTCTYQNCTRRFATPALLQKHKREGHRSTVLSKSEPRSPADRASSTDSPPPSDINNTQAGPHRCDRINPSTGKPCNTIFSRPYDLTRHEDTIHARRGKVQCSICTEEKTFSRADALTRHMRVVHPTVEFPGKHRRRND